MLYFQVAFVAKSLDCSYRQFLERSDANKMRNIGILLMIDCRCRSKGCSFWLKLVGNNTVESDKST